MAEFRSFNTRKKNRIDNVIINSLLVTIAFIALSGPIKEFYIFSIKSFSSLNKSISAKTSSQVGQIINSKQLIDEQAAEIQSLKESLYNSEYKLNALIDVAEKLKASEELLQIKKNHFPKSVAAQILSRSPSSWHQELIIDKGSLNGIKPGMIAITNRGVLGQIQEVKPNYSIIQLMSSSQIRFGAVTSRAKVMGVIFGVKPGYAQLKFVPIGSDAKEGDIVQTTAVSLSGLERNFPMNYPIGQVIKVKKDSSNSEMFIKVKLFEDGSRLSDVLVLVPGDNKFAPNQSFLIPPKLNDSPLGETKASQLSKVETINPKENYQQRQPMVFKKPPEKYLAKPVSQPVDPSNRVIPSNDIMLEKPSAIIAEPVPKQKRKYIPKPPQSSSKASSSIGVNKNNIPPSLKKPSSSSNFNSNNDDDFSLKPYYDE